MEPSSDWYFLERTSNNNNNNNGKLPNGDAEGEWRLDNDNQSAMSKTKDFIAAELSAMSKLNLYEGEDDKIKLDDNISTRSSLLEKRVKDDDIFVNELYGHDEKEKFLLASGESSGNSSDSSPKFNDKRATGDGGDENFEVITNTKTDVHIHVDNYQPKDDHEPDFGNPFGDRLSTNQSLYFEDGIRSVDYVLVWKKIIPQDDDAENAEKDASTKAKELARARAEKREVFEENLLKEGLELESYVIEEEIHFIKIHAPLEVLRRYAEILKLRLPMKEIPGLTTVGTRTKSFITKAVDYLNKKFFSVDKDDFPEIGHRFTATYSRDKEYLFDVEQANFFNTWVRARVCQFILDRKRFSRDQTHDFSFGIDRLVNDQTYYAAYALHDGDLMTEGSRRYQLYTKWSALRKIFSYQPLDYIKDYFGVKIGIYFAWLGFYTYMLILASTAGIVATIYSIRWMKSNPITQQICNKNSTETTYIMCPQCDRLCDYWKLTETCLQAEITSLFDNHVTVIFAVFMSFWATLFLENWKRYSAEITHRWDLTGFDVHEEHPRPQYLARLKSVKREKKDYVTNVTEPNVPFWRMKLPATLLSVSMVLLLISIAFTAVLGIVLYRMSVAASLAISNNNFSASFTILFTTTTAAIINLFLIVLLNYVYEYLAEWLTELELLRTQTEFDDSLTLKIYLLQFVNYYASIFYIAFVKGKFIGTPQNYNRFFDFRQEECGIGGCLMELFIQLAIIMCGKQAMNAGVEMLWPMLMKYLNKMRLRTGRNRDKSIKEKGNRYVNDLKLIEFGSRGLFPEYLEMILQYGFITIFVVAFPLAPFFALLNNIFEMRFDAKKLLVFYRRPIFARVHSIGVWYRILDCISKLSVITNGFIIAFTSDFVPRLVYMLYYSDNGTLDGYVEFTLSKFNVLEFHENSAPTNPSMKNITECYYQDLRYPPDHPLKYQRTLAFWNITAARLIFVLLFENTVAIVMLLVRWLIPDVSGELRDQIRREAYITNEIIIRQETKRAANESSNRSARAFNNQSHWNKILDTDLTGSQLDLYIHNQQETKAKHNIFKRKNKTQDFINKESRNMDEKNLVTNV